MVGGVKLDRLREKSDCLVKLAGREGIVALFLEFFSHTKGFVFTPLDSAPPLKTAQQHAAPTRTLNHVARGQGAAPPSLARCSACTRHTLPLAWARRRRDGKSILENGCDAGRQMEGRRAAFTAFQRTVEQRSFFRSLLGDYWRPLQF